MIRVGSSSRQSLREVPIERSPSRERSLSRGCRETKLAGSHVEAHSETPPFASVDAAPRKLAHEHGKRSCSSQHPSRVASTGRSRARQQLRWHGSIASQFLPQTEKRPIPEHSYTELETEMQMSTPRKKMKHIDSLASKIKTLRPVRNTGVELKQESGRPDRHTESTPSFNTGQYTVVFDKNVPVNLGIERSEDSIVCHLKMGDIVNVLEIASELVDGRIRGRIESPSGWISLYHTNCRRQFAVSQDDLIACWLLAVGHEGKQSSGTTFEESEDEQNGRGGGIEEHEEEEEYEEIEGEPLLPEELVYETPDAEQDAHEDPASPTHLLGSWQGSRQGAMETYDVYLDRGRWKCKRQGREPRIFSLSWHDHAGIMVWGRSYFCSVAEGVSEGQVSWYRRHDVRKTHVAFKWMRSFGD